MPTAFMILGGFVLIVVGLATTIVCFVNPSFMVNDTVSLIFKVFGVFGFGLWLMGWIIDKVDRH